MINTKMSNIAKDLTINFTEFNPLGLVFTKLEENDRSKGQKIAYVRYQNPKTGSEVSPFIQAPWIKLNAYGIPRIDDYHLDDTKRCYIKVPVDLSLEESKKFGDVISQIDKYLDSKEMRQQLFGDNYNKYRYVSLLRIPDEEEKPKEGKKQYPKPPYMKLKLDTTYPDCQVKTQVYKSVLNEGKRERTQITDITTIDDLTRHVSYLSNVRLIMRPVKLWSATKPDKTYGLTFKVIKIEYEPNNKTPSYTKEYLESDVFVDDDNETSNNTSNNTDDEPTKPTKPTKQPEPTKPAKKQVSSNSLDSSDGSDDEPTIPTKPTKSTKQVVSDSDSSDDDDSPVHTVTKQPAKRSVVVESDDSSDDEPVVPAKKPTATVTKKQVVDVESDDSSDDEPKVVVKTTKGKSKK